MLHPLTIPKPLVSLLFKDNRGGYVELGTVSRIHKTLECQLNECVLAIVNVSPVIKGKVVLKRGDRIYFNDQAQALSVYRWNYDWVKLTDLME